jgi:hypothetical protein
MRLALQLCAFSLMMFFGLCITINNKPIFSHIYEVISPATKATQRGVESLAAASYKSAERFSKKLFSNSVPKVKDSVRSGLSAPQRSPGNGVPQEIIENEDREQLDELIKSHN